MQDEKWYKDGIRFECKGCGHCCQTHDDHAYVYLTDREVNSISAFLGFSRIDFLNEHCRTDDLGSIYLSSTTGDCCFLTEEGLCKVYKVRPIQCEAWPFWSENLDEITWKWAVKKVCFGVGEGRLYSASEIEKIAADRDSQYKE